MKTKSTVYVLKLENDCWYVGVTEDMKKRMRKQFLNPSTGWTSKHQPVEIVFTCPGDLAVERQVTMDLVQLYGVDKVRGGSPYHRADVTYKKENVPCVPTKIVHSAFL